MFYLNFFSIWYDSFWKPINPQIVTIMAEDSVCNKIIYQWPGSYFKHYSRKKIDFPYFSLYMHSKLILMWFNSKSPKATCIEEWRAILGPPRSLTFPSVTFSGFGCHFQKEIDDLLEALIAP